MRQRAALLGSSSALLSSSRSRLACSSCACSSATSLSSRGTAGSCRLVTCGTHHAPSQPSASAIQVEDKPNTPASVKRSVVNK